MTVSKTPENRILLIIRDGWGQGKPGPANAIHMAHTPHTDALMERWPHTLLKTSGRDVGLPEGYQGNSEVGHLNIGAGRIVYQSLTRIDLEVESGRFAQNHGLLDLISRTRQRGGRIHLLGLIQEEGVHAVTRHALAAVSTCIGQGFSDIVVHAITDGRDTPPRSALTHMNLLQQGLDRLGAGHVGSVLGRYYAMDRDHRWDRTQLACATLMEGRGERFPSWQAAIAAAYERGEGDEFIRPCTIGDFQGISPEDGIFFFNFRFDRTRQLTQALVEPDFSAFPRSWPMADLLAMTHYYDQGHFQEAFPEMPLEHILGEELSRHGIPQLRCAETEKFAHVTFFFNALRNDPFPGEDRILVDSPRVATYDLQPEMSAFEVRDKLLEAIRAEQYPVIICNFANGDMVGHTGIKPAIMEAVETVDQCVGAVTEAWLERGGIDLITADHGNAEQTELEDGSPMTAHTTNPVPLILAGLEGSLRSDGRLCDLAPTILHLLGLPVPEEMTGATLLEGSL